jgi:hypothetical protein
MKPTKISKYFEVESNNPLYYRPGENIQNGSKNTSDTSRTLYGSVVKNTISSSFDTFNIHLVTLYQPSISTISFALYFPNNNSLNISSKIENISNPIVGDLHCLYQSLKYVVYHPSTFLKLNKHKFIITTNSENITSIYKPSAALLESNLYFKIQSLLNCIKHVSIEYSENTEGAYNFLKANLC